LQLLLLRLQSRLSTFSHHPHTPLRLEQVGAAKKNWILNFCDKNKFEENNRGRYKKRGFLFPPVCFLPLFRSLLFLLRFALAEKNLRGRNKPNLFIYFWTSHTGRR
jgi:hypothetical protein